MDKSVSTPAWLCRTSSALFIPLTPRAIHLRGGKDDAQPPERGIVGSGQVNAQGEVDRELEDALYVARGGREGEGKQREGRVASA